MWGFGTLRKCSFLPFTEMALLVIVQYGTLSYLPQTNHAIFFLEHIQIIFQLSRNSYSVSSTPLYRVDNPLCWDSLCIRATYCFDTVFHELMYFSMQFVKQFSSPLESEVPGLGTQRSKQCSLSF